ncbi:MAG: LysM peptidoglycan-binding domain-containing protein [Chitinophagaceae bacterium]|nr:LysM peptidoglycan-binding domain-containing protein [Anaerolineae bacterium]
MFRKMLILCLIIVLVGCNLNNNDADSGVGNLATATIAPAATESPDGSATSAPIGCTPRPDWLAYTILPGDTLTGIAVRTGSSVDALIQGNCLQNPDTLDIGQTLLVPQTPSNNPSTLAPDSNCLEGEFFLNTGTDFLTITPYLSFDGACYGLQTGITVTVAWVRAPAGTNEVTFYRNNPSLSRADVIGTDSTPADGFSIQWLTYVGMPPSVLYAFGVGSVSSDSDAIGIFVVTP